ncbi:hypothetical protein LCI18_008588 [Fusarium solani-melongenae]|uniref:Uncharacterized protein n=1 Tax=Fusarium solani subsp. cucurbitae TaxID=2747967 RepID=A0ACD3ZC41_FUSSC|nr:hypothetical protein LCI18_008588 [Fusarium solani-melongenae]
MYAQNAVVLALAGLAAAQTTTTPGPVPIPTGSSNGTITVTKVYDVYTTYCPGPTSFVIGGKDYVVTEPCTLTITDCPCTVVETHAPTWIPQPPPVVPGCPGGDHCTTTGDNTKGQTPKTSDTACEGDDCAPVIVNGAGAIQISLGLAAVFGLFAL